MITKIVLENFMAHEHTEVALGPGVTALTGPNNTGKSAIVEALRCVATNPTPRHFIRHGAKEARVAVELEDGARVVWVRKKRSAGYELHLPGEEEPREYWKLGRGLVPEEVRQVLRLDPVDLDGGERIDVHIGNQREPVFLLNLPDRAVADFLASSTEGAHLLSMQGALKRRVMDARKEAAGREARLRGIAGELDSLAPLPELTLKAEAARELEERMLRLQAEIPALENLISQRAALEQRMYWLRRGAKAMEGVIPPPELQDVRQLGSILDQQAMLAGQQAQAQGVAGTLQGLAEPPRAEPLQPLAELLRELQSVAEALNRAGERGTVLEPVAAPPELFDDAPLRSAAAAMDDMLRRREQAQQGLQSLEREMDEFEAALKERLERLGCCPTCGGVLDAEAFLAKGGSHDA
ncbi:AAA family ATPase [Salidesulfovibrio onnuriiensis]|uniref:AAA family ATPase n=1 Tax=Salidesulfovibrio onnuriiensis TaxID=2583823 RepID=UPI0011CA5D61|nr:AAA family ATPase [Salidesulfovibrio onnuriiensis]